MTDAERAALVMQITLMLRGNEPLAEAILACVEPDIRADERARVVDVLHDGMEALDALVGERLGGDTYDDDGTPLRGSYHSHIPWKTRSQARAALAAIRAALGVKP